MATDPYESLVRNASDIVAISTDDGTLRWIGPSITRALGYDAEELIGRNCFDLLHHDDQERAVAFHVGLADPGVPSQPIELRFRSNDGSWRWFEAILTPMLHDPSIAGTVVNARDITDRVEALAALRDSELRFRGFASAVPVGLVFVDPDGLLTYANDRWLEITGVTPEDAQGTVWLDMLHPEDVPVIVSRLASHHDGDEVLDQVHRIVRPDGHTVWIRSRVARVRTDDGNLRGYTGAVEDVTAELEALAATDQLRETIDACVEYILVVEGGGRILYANAAVRALLAEEPGPDALVRDFASLIRGDGYDAYIAALTPALLETGHWEGEMILRASDGREIPVLQSAHAHFDTDGRLAYVTAIGKDISDRKAFEAELAERERRYRALAQHASDVVTVNDEHGTVVYVSPSVKSASGFEPEELIGKPGLDMIHPDDVPALQELAKRVASPASMGSTLYRVRRKDGSYRYVEGVATNLSHDPAIGGWLVTARDIDDRHRAEMLLKDQARILELVARGGTLQDTLTAVAQLVNQWIDGICVVVGLSEAGHLHLEAAADMPDDLSAALNRIPVPLPDEVFTDERTYELDLAQVRTLPRVRDALLAHGVEKAWIAPIGEPGGDAFIGAVVACVQGTASPTERDESLLALAANIAGICVQGSRNAQTLAHRARHDTLTELPNREYLLGHVSEVLQRGQDSGDVAVLFLDLDRFKVLNDSLGHAAGDRMLVEIAQRLRAAIRPGDVVARFGGDEFVVCCAGLQSRESAIEIADRLLAVVEKPLGPAGSHIVMTASIGMAMAEPRATADSLVRDADAAMYRAKDKGRAQWALFDDRLRARVVGRLQIERELRSALEHGELELYYQPAVALGWDTLLGFEALVRWNHPSRGLLEPAEFLDIAEETGLARPIGTWVVEQACRQAMDWLVRFPEWGSFVMGANLSVRLLSDRLLPRRIEEILVRTGMVAEHLVLEITEHALQDDTAMIRRSLTELSQLGVFLALDDFGTGYTNLGLLKDFPVNALKVDRSFIDRLLGDAQEAAIVTSIVDLAHSLDLFVIAEGVEAEAQAHKLQELGVGMAQGHLWSPPRPVADIERLLADSRIRFTPSRTEARSN